MEPNSRNGSDGTTMVPSQSFWEPGFCDTNTHMKH